MTQLGLRPAPTPTPDSTPAPSPSLTSVLFPHGIHRVEGVRCAVRCCGELAGAAGWCAEHDAAEVRAMRRPHVYRYQGRRIVLESQGWADFHAGGPVAAAPAAEPKVCTELPERTAPPPSAALCDGWRAAAARGRIWRERHGHERSRPAPARLPELLEPAPASAPPAQCAGPPGPRWPTWVMLPSRAQLDEQLDATYPDVLARAVAVAIVLADRDTWRAAAAKYFDQGLDESAAARQAVVELERVWRVQRGLERLERPTAVERRAAAQARLDAQLAAGDGRIAATSLDGRVVCTARLRIMPPIPCLACGRRCAPLAGVDCFRCEAMHRSYIQQPPGGSLQAWATRWLSADELDQWRERAAFLEEATGAWRHAAERRAFFEVWRKRDPGGPA